MPQDQSVEDIVKQYGGSVQSETDEDIVKRYGGSVEPPPPEEKGDRYPVPEHPGPPKPPQLQKQDPLTSVLSRYVGIATEPFRASQRGVQRTLGGATQFAAGQVSRDPRTIARGTSEMVRGVG